MASARTAAILTLVAARRLASAAYTALFFARRKRRSKDTHVHRFDFVDGHVVDVAVPQIVFCLNLTVHGPEEPDLLSNHTQPKTTRKQPPPWY